MRRVCALPTQQTRYDRVAMALHWLIGVLLLGQIAFGFLLDELAPRGTPARGTVINLHKSVGMVLGILILLRLFWRWRHRPPVWPAAMPVWQRSAAALSHRALYACMLLLPVSAYVGSNFSKHGVRFFGIALAPWGPDLPAVYGFCTGVHDLSAWTLTGLLCLHVAAALQHALLRRDGLWQRMWPGSPT